jgi:hypothetical protein
MNFKIFRIPSVYTIWDGLNLKTISRYCPFKDDMKGFSSTSDNLFEQYSLQFTPNKV